MALALPELLGRLHGRVRHELEDARAALDHAVAKGDASERIWIKLFNKFLPQRYCADRAFVIDSGGKSSLQIDVAVYDQQYTPLIFELEGQLVIPAEAVYGVFEAKQELSADTLKDAHAKAKSVRELTQTSLPLVIAGIEQPARSAIRPLAGALALESAWKPPLGDALAKQLSAVGAAERLDIGCIANHGLFYSQGDGYELRMHEKATTAFLLELVARLQSLGTAPAIDVRAYAAWL